MSKTIPEIPKAEDQTTVDKPNQRIMITDLTQTDETKQTLIIKFADLLKDAFDLVTRGNAETQNPVTVGGLSVTPFTAEVAPPSNVTLSQVFADAENTQQYYFVARGYTYKFRVYAYKLFQGVRIYSKQYAENAAFVDANDNQNFAIQLNWDAPAAGADGYVIIPIVSRVTNGETDYYYNGNGEYETTLNSVLWDENNVYAGTGNVKVTPNDVYPDAVALASNVLVKGILNVETGIHSDTGAIDNVLAQIIKSASAIITEIKTKEIITSDPDSNLYGNSDSIYSQLTRSTVAFYDSSQPKPKYGFVTLGGMGCFDDNTGYHLLFDLNQYLLISKSIPDPNGQNGQTMQVTLAGLSPLALTLPINKKADFEADITLLNGRSGFVYHEEESGVLRTTRNIVFSSGSGGSSSVTFKQPVGHGRYDIVRFLLSDDGNGNVNTKTLFNTFPSFITVAKTGVGTYLLTFTDATKHFNNGIQQLNKEGVQMWDKDHKLSYVLTGAGIVQGDNGYASSFQIQTLSPTTGEPIDVNIYVADLEILDVDMSFSSDY